MENQSTGSLNNVYLNRYASQETLLSVSPDPSLRIILTIPCFNEPDLLGSLTSIDQCHPTHAKTEVIVLINDAEGSEKDIKAQNRKSFDEASEWIKSRKNNHIDYHVIYKEDLPEKHAGVGMARKLAMDEAVRRFESIECPDGIIVCFDADSQCDKNYLQAILTYFERNLKSPGCSIYYEHPLNGPLASEIYEAITDYELFLRFYTNALRIAKFPYAYQTVGSSMAVRSWAYQKQGGMPKRKAGEDFHFINKIIPLGNFGEINDTKVMPSPRTSDRVPFGTGKAVKDWLKTNQLLTYNTQTFEDLEKCFTSVDLLYNSDKRESEGWLTSQPKSIIKFLERNEFTQQIERINKSSTSLSRFIKHFFQWFDAFQCMKFIHYSRDHYYRNIPISEAVGWLLKRKGIECSHLGNHDLLLKLRQLDREGYFLDSLTTGH